MEIEYRVLNLYRTKQYDECLKLCAEALQNNADRMVEFIHLRVLTIQTKITGNGYEEVGCGYGAQDDDLVTTAVAKTPRPGTSFQRELPKTAQSKSWQQRTASAGSSATMRRTAGTSLGRARTALRSASRAATAVAAASLTGASLFRAGAPLTLTLMTKQDKLFATSAKALFEYVFYNEGDVRKALEIALQAHKEDNNPDWWWDFTIAKCYIMLGMSRMAEDSLRQALKKNKHVAIYLRLISMYVELNQPLSALEVCRNGLSIFHEDTAILIEQARIHEDMGNSSLAVQDYRRVALEDATNLEATANIAMYNFYNDQPEIALRYYRRLLATSFPGPEIYNNLGLCCLHCNQWDLILPCFRQALYYSTNSNTSGEIWFNLAHVALSTGDLVLARRCLLVSLAMSSEHEAARKALYSLDAVTRAKHAK